MPDPKELKNSTATGAEEIKFHEELKEPSLSAAPDQAAPAGKASAKDKGTSTRGPPDKKSPTPNFGPKKHEMLWIDDEEYSSLDHFARKNGLTKRYVNGLMNHPTFPLPHVVIAGRRYIREKSAGTFFRQKQKRDSEANRVTWKRKLELLNQKRIDDVKAEIVAEREGAYGLVDDTDD